MRQKLRFILCSAGALALAACSSSSTGPTDSGPTLCTGYSSPCVAFPAGTLEGAIDSAVAQATAGTTFVFGAGTFSFTNTLAIPAVNGLTFAGASLSTTILDFTSQTAGSGGISAVLGNNAIKFQNFSVKNSHGDGIKVLGATGVVFEAVGVSWSDTDVTTHGAYGLYPVQSESVLVDHCVVSGARDTGLYIGQSFNIIVSNNTVTDNVAGIEIESSVNADVYGNDSNNNTGGILVFALPALLPPPDSGQPNDGTTNVRVYNNNVHDNNTPNFGDPSGTVYGIPGGTGIVILAATNVEVYGNTITNNYSDGFAVVSYFLLDATYDPTDPANNAMNPFPYNVYVHDNTFTGNGAQPIPANLGGAMSPLGSLLEGLILYGGFPAGTVPDLLWDGIANEGPPLNYVPPPVSSPTAGTPANPYLIYVENNTSATGWCNLNLPITAAGGTLTPSSALGTNFDSTDFTVSAPPAGFPLPAVDAGVSP